MIRRWRSIVDPGSVDTLSPPSTRGALAMWFLGSAWLLYGVWLALLGLPVWLPAVPVVGLLGLWVWKRRSSVTWVPLALVSAALADARLEGTTTSHLIDLVLTGLAFVIAARAIAKGEARREGTMAERALAVAAVAGLVIGLLDPEARDTRTLRLVIVSATVMATAWIGTRRAFMRDRLRAVFPWAVTLLGGAVLFAVLGARPEPSPRSAAGLLLIIAATMPFAWSAVLRPGPLSLPSLVAAFMGTFAYASTIGVLVGYGPEVIRLAEPGLLIVLTVVVAALSVPGFRAVRLGSAIACAALAGLVGDARLVPVAVLIGSTAIGLAATRPAPRAPRVVTLSLVETPESEEESCDRRSA